MKFIPHKYQEFATRFICDHPESMLLLDMGLGSQNGHQPDCDHAPDV